MIYKREPKNSVKRKKIKQYSLAFMLVGIFCMMCSMSLVVLTWILEEPSVIMANTMVPLSIAGLIFSSISTVLKWKEICMSANDADEK